MTRASRSVLKRLCPYFCLPWQEPCRTTLRSPLIHTSVLNSLPLPVCIYSIIWRERSLLLFYCTLFLPALVCILYPFVCIFHLISFYFISKIYTVFNDMLSNFSVYSPGTDANVEENSVRSWCSSIWTPFLYGLCVVPNLWNCVYFSRSSENK